MVLIICVFIHKGWFHFLNIAFILSAELENGMVPVESVDIEHIQQDGTTTSINNLGKQEEQTTT